MKTKKLDVGKTKAVGTKTAGEAKDAVKAAAVSAEKNETEAKSEPAKETSVKASAAKTAGRKSVLKKHAAAKEPAAEKTPAAETKSVVKRGSRKTADVAKPTEEKTSKRRSAAVVPAEEKPVVKRGPRKPVTIETICEKVEKKISKTKAAKINKTIAVDIEVWGFEDGSSHKMFIEVKEGKVNVQPYPYDAKNFRVAINFANATAFINNKVTLAELIESNEFYAEGNIVDALKLASIF